MTLREKLEQMRAHVDLHWDEQLSPRGFGQVIALIDVALAACDEVHVEVVHHDMTEVALGRLDRAMDQ